MAVSLGGGLSLQPDLRIAVCRAAIRSAPRCTAQDLTTSRIQSTPSLPHRTAQNNKP